MSTPLNAGFLGIIVGQMLSRANVGATGPQGPAGPVGPAGPTGPSLPTPFTGRFFDETTVQNIYVSTTGSDTAGNGLTTGTAYATVARAMRDIPEGWTADVSIEVAAGTYAGNQTWSLFSLPGSKVTTTGTGRVRVIGATTEEDLVGAVAGVAVAGTLSQFDYAIGPFTSPVTECTRHVRDGTSYLYNARPVMASVTPTLRVVAADGSAFTDPKLCAWATTFSGTVIFNAPVPLGPTRYAFICAIEFSATLTTSNCQMRGCLYQTNTTSIDSSHVAGSFRAGTATISGARLNDTSITASLWATGAVSMSGMVQSFTSNTMLGTAAVAKVMGGGSSATITTALHPAWLRQFVLNDFRDIGTVVRWIGGVIHSGVALAACTITVTGGAPVILHDGARVMGAAGWTWTGTGDLPTDISEGSAFDTAGGFQCTNSAAPGTDVIVGELAAQATAVRPTTAPLELCRYT